MTNEKTLVKTTKKIRSMKEACSGKRAKQKIEKCICSMSESCKVRIMRGRRRITYTIIYRSSVYVFIISFITRGALSRTLPTVVVTFVAL